MSISEEYALGDPRSYFCASSEQKLVSRLHFYSQNISKSDRSSPGKHLSGKKVRMKSCYGHGGLCGARTRRVLSPSMQITHSGSPSARAARFCMLFVTVFPRYRSNPEGRSRYQTSEFPTSSEFHTELPTHMPPPLPRSVPRRARLTGF